MHRKLHLHHIYHHVKFKLSGLSSSRNTGGGGVNARYKVLQKVQEE